MLKTIDPLLNADVLYALRAMGHGDRLVICDTNFPADAIARQTTLGRLLRIDNVSAARAVGAVLSVLPLDTFVDDAAIRMEIVGKPAGGSGGTAGGSSCGRFCRRQIPAPRWCRTPRLL